MQGNSTIGSFQKTRREEKRDFRLQFSLDPMNCNESSQLHWNDIALKAFGQSQLQCIFLAAVIVKVDSTCHSVKNCEKLKWEKATVWHEFGSSDQSSNKAFRFGWPLRVHK